MVQSRLGAGQFVIGAALLLAAGCARPMTADRSPQDNARFTLDHGGIIRGDRTRHDLSIIFTADQFGEGAAHVLDTLAAHHVQASFFLTGRFLRDPRFRSHVGRMIADGHYVGPHSDQHPLYCSWENRAQSLVTRAQFRDDLQANLKELRTLGVRYPGGRVLYIPPYEWYNDEQVRWAGEMNVRIFNLTPGVGSNRDYIPEGQRGFRPSTQILDEVWTYEARDPDGLNGAIILVHLGVDRRDKLFLLLGPFLDQLAARGYRPIRVDTLLAR